MRATQEDCECGRMVLVGSEWMHMTSTFLPALRQLPMEQEPDLRKTQETH